MTQKADDRFEMIATAAFGLESVVARELNALGFSDTKSSMGKVVFSGGLADIPKLNLWLRASDRVLVKMGEFRATTFDELFEATKALPWEDWLPANANFPVEGRSVLSTLFSVSDCQAIVKKAIVERMKTRYRKDWFPEDGPRYRIEVALLKDVATLTLDTTGPGLHKRGYRKLTGAAPLKETLAASMLYLSRWTPDRPLMDPFCGTGTIAIEAAMMGHNMAPGLTRDFASESWPIVGSVAWEAARREARAKVKYDVELSIEGYDIDPSVLELAAKGAKEAGVAGSIRFGHRAVKDMSTDMTYGHVITNPPYGERLGDRRSVEVIYKEMKKAFTDMGTWSFMVLTSFGGFEKVMGLYADKKRKVFNGQIECTLYQFFGPKPPRNE